MSWNLRIILREYPDGTKTHGLHEVFYDEMGNVDSYTSEPVDIYFEDLSEVRQYLEWALLATEKPVLIEKELLEMFEKRKAGV